LKKLMIESGCVLSTEAHVIYSNDDYEIDFADDRKVIKHTPHYLLGKEKGEFVAVYDIAILPSRIKHVEIIPADEIYKIRGKSEGYKYWAGHAEAKRKALNSPVWVEWFDQMAKKAVLKRHNNTIPKVSGLNTEAIHRAIEIDNQDYDLGKDKSNVKSEIFEDAEVIDEPKTDDNGNSSEKKAGSGK